MKEVFWKLSDILYDSFSLLKKSIRDLGLTIKICSICGKRFISRRYWETCPKCYAALVETKNLKIERLDSS